MFRLIATWIGRLAAVVAVGVLLWSAKVHWAALSGWTVTPKRGLLIAAVSVAYGLAFLLVGEAWHRLISGVSGSVLRRNVTWPSFGVTQVAKYLPGNVLHYVGRHIWLTRRGVAHSVVVTAAIWEAALMAGTALLCGSVTAILFPFAELKLGPLDLSIVLKVVAPVLVVGALGALAVRRFVPRLVDLVPPASTLIQAGLVLFAFFLAQGFLFSLLFYAVGVSPRPAGLAIASLSWAVGYLTPGAPGGLGSREAALVALASPLVGVADALILAGLFRLVTTVGDLICFLINSLVARSDRTADTTPPIPA